MSSSTPSYLRQAADKALRDQRWSDAFGLFDQLFQGRPEQLDLALRMVALSLLTEQEQEIDRIRRTHEAATGDPVPFLLNLGNQLVQHGRHRQAIPVLAPFTRSHPSVYAVWDLYGQALFHSGAVPKALDAYTAAMEHLPSETFALNITRCYQELGEAELAYEAAERAIRFAPGSSGAWSAYCSALIERGQLASALRAGRRAVFCQPESVPAHIKCAIAEELTEPPEITMERYRTLIRLDPASVEFPHHLATSYLRLGQDEAARAVYRAPPGPWQDSSPHPCIPAWRGEALEGRTLLLLADRGRGDMIMFAQLAGQLAAVIDGPVILNAPRAMVPLLSTLPPPIRVIDKAACFSETVDVQLPLSALPFHGPILHPAGTPYLQPDPERVQFWKDALPPLGPGQKMQIGVIWQGGKSMERKLLHKRRSFPVTHLAGIVSDPRIRTISLQLDHFDLDGNALMTSHVIRLDALDAGAIAYQDTAAIMMHLDLVITSDTSIAHLAGALGRPTWVMLNARADWRYGTGTDHSRWYNSHRLFRQTRQNDWRSAFRQAEAALETHFTKNTPLV